ncbi:electron transfer flavoprotein subunit beta [Geminicoccus flavidas]|uniref:electron transfer flavoprotein subunit beta n=1 Tax=Geminicoccus flavidas TaxID=2506407 RepID=UPI00135BEB87|nr:electron transfer flavoprotein subunit beta [Geminicoccus flavidas]
MAEIVTLLSAGCHPETGRLRPAAGDAAALALGLALRASGHRLIGLHAGPADDALRVYAGFAEFDLVRLNLSAQADALPVILPWLALRRPALVLAGPKAELGAGTGLLPYALAEAMGAACIPEVAGVEELAERVTLVQALPGGRRRRLAAPAPAVLVAAGRLAPPSGWAYARAQRARLETVPATALEPVAATAWRNEPARPLARPVRRIRGGAAARMAAATSFTAGEGQLLVQPAPDEAARAILAYLEGQGLLRS